MSYHISYHIIYHHISYHISSYIISYITSCQLISHWTDFIENWFLIIFLKSVEKVQVLLKYDKNNGDLT